MPDATATATVTITSGAPTDVSSSATATVVISSPNTQTASATAVVTISSTGSGWWHVRGNAWRPVRWYHYVRASGQTTPQWQVIAAPPSATPPPVS